MDERSETTGVSDHRKASAWPFFVALGLVVSEVGVLFGFYPVAVGGLLLLVGSVAAIVTEAGYTDRPWNLLVALGALLVVVGALVVWTQVPTVEASFSAVDGTNGVVVRGFAIAGAGLVAAVAGLVGRMLEYGVIDANQ